VVEILSFPHRDALEGLLNQDPVCNLFLLGWLRQHELDRMPWFGAFDRGALVGAALVVPGRLVVPYTPDAAWALRLGERLRANHIPAGMVIGPRLAVDALWTTWRPGPPRIWYDQRLYLQDAPPDGPAVPGFRLATLRDAPALIDASAEMEREDLGRDPRDVEPEQHETVTRDRIRQGRSWVIERSGRIVFHIHVGTFLPEGAQVGGTYVPPDCRGQGLAAAGMAELGRRLLRGPDAPARITLHVHEQNTAAVRAYLRAGYRPAHAYRLAAVAGGGSRGSR
jgi:hypothetical protein